MKYPNKTTQKRDASFKRSRKPGAGQGRFEKCVYVFFPWVTQNMCRCCEMFWNFVWVVCIGNLRVAFLLLCLAFQKSLVAFMHCPLNFDDVAILSILKCGHVKHTTWQSKMEEKDVLPCTIKAYFSIYRFHHSDQFVFRNVIFEVFSELKFTVYFQLSGRSMHLLWKQNWSCLNLLHVSNDLPRDVTVDADQQGPCALLCVLPTTGGPGKAEVSRLTSINLLYLLSYHRFKYVG